MESSYVQTFSSCITKTNDSQNSAQWLESELNKHQISVTKQSEGVYFCIAHTRSDCGGSNILAVVVLPDHCSNPVFLQAGFLCTLPHCLIAERPVYSNTIGSTISHISEFTSGTKILTKEIEKSITQFGEAKPVNPFACVVPAMPVDNNDKLILSRSETAIYINDIEMINKRTKIQFDILNLLTNSALNDALKRTTTYLNALKIAHNLKENKSEKDIYNAFFRIKESLDQVIPHEKIITHIHSLGYRLNTQNIAIKMEKRI
jgi:hypothetical protein